MEPELKQFWMEPEPEIWVTVQASYTNKTMFFSVFWTKLFWSRSQKNRTPGAGAGAWNLSTGSTALIIVYCKHRLRMRVTQELQTSIRSLFQVYTLFGRNAKIGPKTMQCNKNPCKIIR